MTIASNRQANQEQKMDGNHDKNSSSMLCSILKSHIAAISSSTDEMSSPNIYIFTNKWINQITEINNTLIQIDRVASDQKQIDSTNKYTDKKPSILLTINELRTVYTTLEVLWYFIYTSFFKPLFSFDSSDDHPSSLTISKSDSLKLVGRFKDLSMNEADAWKLTLNMYHIATHPLFSGTMLQRTMKRILLSIVYFQNYHPKFSLPTCPPSSSSPLASISLPLVTPTELAAILVTGPFKSIVITSLKALNKGPDWMKAIGSRMFSDIIVSEGGLEAVLLSYLDGEYIYYYYYCVKILMLLKYILTCISFDIFTGTSYSPHATQMQAMVVKVRHISSPLLSPFTNHYHLLSYCIIYDSY